MNATTAAFFSLLRAGLRLEPAAGHTATPPSAALQQPLDADAWAKIYRLASAQGVLALVWDGVRGLAPELQPPQKLRLQWAYNVDRMESRYRLQERTIAKLAAFYAGLGIDMMLLKGYGLSRLYPVPEHRPCGDIDIWLFGEHRHADEAMRRAWGTAIDDDKDVHTVFHIDGVMVENHYDFVNTSTHASNARLAPLLDAAAASRGERIELPPPAPKPEAAPSGTPEAPATAPSPEAATVAVYFPPVAFDSLFLVRHAAAHFAAAEIGVRHLADWAMFVARHHSQIDWDALYDASHKIGMTGFLNCLNAICIDYLGVDASFFPPLDRDAALEERVLNDILSPEFSDAPPRGLPRVLIFKIRRWWANRWKHRIVYNENLLGAFFQSAVAHLRRPRSIAST